MMSERDHDRAAEATLLASRENDYGADYRDHYLTLYRDYVASADAISERRNTANGVFLSINTAFIGAQGYFEVDANEYTIIQAVLGLLFCLVWWRMIQSYKTLNGSKFDVIQLMERHLPLAPYTTEELVQKTGPTLHRALSTVESYVPALFAVLHIAVAFINFTHIS